MWHRWTLFCSTCLHDKSLQKLAIAIAISFVLHLFLLGSAYLSLPALDSVTTQVLTAELVTKEPAKNLLEPVTKAPEVVTPEIKKSEVKPFVEPEQTNKALEPEVTAEPTGTEQTASAEPALDNTPIPTAENPPQENQTDLGLEINTQAYKYVETEFDVRTDIDANVKSSAAGRAKMVYQLLPNAEYYQIDSLMEPSGIASLFISDLVQKSTGLLTDRGLQPINFLYQYGDKADKTYKATFDWDNVKLKMQTAKGEKQVPLEKGAQDLLSFMYQFMFVPPLNDMQLYITNGKKLSHYEYSFEGEAIIFSKMGNLNTIHIARSNANNDDKIELWLALDYQYVPVKIRKSEKNGKVYELLVTSLKTTKPDLQNNQQLNKSASQPIDADN